MKAADEQLKNNILKCAGRGSLQDLKDSLLTHTSSNFNWKKVKHDRSGDTVLHYAARVGAADILRYLFNICIDPNTSATCNDAIDFEQSNCDGKTPLHEAAQHSRLLAVKFLLEFGVSVDSLKRADW